MGIVWELDLAKPLKFLLLALADHADHNGENAYPGIRLLAWKTGDSERTVHRGLRALTDLGLIEVVEAGGGLMRGRGGGLRGRATVYRLTLDNGDTLAPFEGGRVIPSPSTTVTPRAVNDDIGGREP
jgi:hypothetical protein